MILFYPHNDDDGIRLENTVAPIVEKETLVVIHEFEILLEYLKRPNSEHKVLLYLAASEEQLQQLCRNVALLDNLKKILVLFDNSSYIMKVACTISPTYMANISNDYKDILDVLTKIKSRFLIL